jgi:hypothetical protein
MKTIVVKQGVVLSFTILTLAACGGSAPSATDGGSDTARNAVIQIDPLATFDSGFIEIDACPNTFLGDTPGCVNSAWAGDANLFLGPDKDTLLKIGKTTYTQPSPSQSYAYPGPAGSTFIDWETLLSDATKKPNHVRFDFQSGNAPDPTSFPQSNSCVGSSQVLSKMDLTAVTVSNNATYAYFGVQRKDNDGDAGYMWLFTKQVPLNPTDGSGCGPTELRYRLTDGDVMFRGHFVADVTEKLLFVYTIPTNPPTIVAGKTITVSNTNYTAVCPGGGQPCYIEIPAKDAINWQNGLWLEKADGVAAAAVNSSPAGAGNLGLGGVGATVPLNGTATVGTGQNAQTWKCTDPAGCMGANIFAEVAVPVAVFTGGTAVCNATFYGSVITRPSGNNPTPDMKDLAGPYQFNFGSAAITVSATPSCSQQFGYKIDSFTSLGGPQAPSTCTWKLNGPGFAADYVFDSDCSSYPNGDTFANANLNGTYNLSVTAEAGGCSATGTTSVNAYPALGASAALDGTCALTFDYTGSGSGGSGGYTYAWAFSGPSTPSPASSTSASGTGVAVTAPGTYTGNLTVTDTRTDISCTAPASGSDAVYAPVALALSVTPTPSLTCPDTDTSTAAVFTAAASQGSGSYTYHWGGACSTTGTTDPTCDVDDASACGTLTLDVYVTDAVCGNTAPKYGKYDKVTTISTQVGNTAF